MTTEAQSDALADSKRRLIEALDVWQEQVDPCKGGHMDHTADDHLGRRLVHTYAGGWGAEWDYEAAVEYINAAVRVVKSGPPYIAMGHAGAAYSPDGRLVAFATKKDEQ